MNMHIDHLQNNPESAPSGTTVLWVPGEKVVLHQIPQPTAPKRKWLELVAWQLEDRLLQRVEEMHFVIIGHNADDTLAVLAVSKQTMRGWLEQAGKAQISNFLLIPDYLALPWEEGSISVAQRGELLLVRSGQLSGFTANPALVWGLIEALIAQSPELLQLSVAIPLEMLPENLRGSAENNLMAPDWHLAKPLPAANLLTGEFRLKRSMFGSRKQWAIAALLLLGLAFALPYLIATDKEHIDKQQAQPRTTVSQAVLPTNANNTIDTVQTVNAPIRQTKIQVNAELLGVVINSKSSSATIRVDGQPEKVFHIDDEITRGQKITDITPDGVTIEERGQSLTISLKKYEALIVHQEQGEHAYAEKEGGFELANMFAAVPVQVDNYDTGLKLDNLSEEMKMLVDIREGDVVVQVGTSGIQDLLSEPTLWTNYSTNTEVPVIVIRDGEEVVLTVNAFSLSAKMLPNLASEFMP